MNATEGAYTAVAVASILPYMMTTVFSYANIAAEDFRSNVIASLVSAIVGFLALVSVMTGLAALVFIRLARRNS